MLMKKVSKKYLAKAWCDSQLANTLINLAVATGNNAKVLEPKLKLPQPQKPLLQKENS